MLLRTTVVHIYQHATYSELAVHAHHIMINQEAYTPKDAQSLIT
jgi:hypothetical protein